MILRRLIGPARDVRRRRGAVGYIVMKHARTHEAEFESWCELAHAVSKGGWGVRAELETVIALIRSGDPRVSLRALGVFRRVLREVGDPALRREVGERVERWCAEEEGSSPLSGAGGRTN